MHFGHFGNLHRLARSFSTHENKAKNIEDLILNYTQVGSTIERMRLIVQAAAGAIADPTRADLVSAIGDLTSSAAL